LNVWEKAEMDVQQPTVAAAVVVNIGVRTMSP
jgi:hypothetical protein